MPVSIENFRLPRYREIPNVGLYLDQTVKYINPFLAPLGFPEVTPGLVAALEAMQPTGYGNPAPLFRATASVVEARAVGLDGAHLKLTLAQGGRRLGGIAFREGPRAGALEGDVDALFVPKLNTWMGRTEAQLEVRELAEADVFARLASKLGDEPRLQCDFLTEIIYNKPIAPVAPLPEAGGEALARWLAERPQGTLVVTAELACAEALLRGLGEDIRPDLAVGALPEDPRAFNAICVCPDANRLGRGWRRVVLAGVPAEWLPTDCAAEVLRLDTQAAWTQKLPDVETMRQVYSALMRALRRPAWHTNRWQLARVAADEAGVAELTAAASILAMEDMGLFALEQGTRGIAVRRSPVAKASPEDSAVWRRLEQWRQSGV